MSDLFGQVHSAEKIKTSGPDVRTIIACRKLNLSSPLYKMSGWQAVTDGYIIYVCDVLGVKTKGKNKGRTKWGKDRHKALVMDIEINVELEKWEKETGKCCKCGGDGQEWAGWHRDTGNSYRDCTRCGTTGVAPSTPLENSMK
jgi:hypothetical protein